MLNELLIAERGLARAGVSMTLRHPDIRSCARIPTVRVSLDRRGVVDEVAVVSPDRTQQRPLWKMSEGQKNSFPFVKPNSLWAKDAISQYRALLPKKPTLDQTRNAILKVAASPAHRKTQFGEWSGKGARESLLRRLDSLRSLRTSDARVVFAAGTRLCRVLDTTSRPEALPRLIAGVSSGLIELLRNQADEATVAVVVALLTESGAKGGAMYFNASGSFAYTTTDEGLEHGLFTEMRDASRRQSGRRGTCQLSGQNDVPLIDGTFSQPNLPHLLQTFLFARNDATPSLARYRRKGSQTVSVGFDVDVRYRAALEALVAPERYRVTWREIEREKPRRKGERTPSDLLIAYVEASQQACIAELITTEKDFEQLTEELLDLVRAHFEGSGLEMTPVRISVIRAVDKTNRKILMHDSYSVHRLVAATIDWRSARRLLPPNFTLSVPEKGKKLAELSPPNVAPLTLIRFTQPLFIRGGTERTDSVGITAAEALALFLDEGRDTTLMARRILHLVLQRRTALVAGCSHARHREFDDLSKFDRLEVLRTVSVLCVLLHKLGLKEETDMTDSPAYKLGQLLNAVDAVHAGYCADVRGGQLPPSLLGNQVFATARKSPVLALKLLCQRWKAYSGWINRTRRDEKRLDALRKKEKKSRGEWDIVIALSQAGRCDVLAAELNATITSKTVGDVFEAQLLLGYLAGLPKRERDDADDETNNDNEGNEQ